MSDELTRLRDICSALLKYDRYAIQADIKEAVAKVRPECWSEAEDAERLAKEALDRAIRLARKEQI